MKPLSVAEKLLLAAHRLELSGVRPFTAEDLVISAWEHYPDTFGLAGHADANGRALYPDSNRVFAEIMGAKPIRQHGYLEKVGSKLYTVTEIGRVRASELLSGPAPASSKTNLSRELKEQVRALLDSRAFTKWKSERPDEITFLDACGFWGITPRSSAIELESRLAGVARLLDLAANAFAAGNVTLEHAGDVIAPGAVESLRAVDSELKTMFRPDLVVIRKRTDERA